MKIIATASAAILLLSSQAAFAQDACKPAVLPNRPAIESAVLPAQPPEKPACAEKGTCSKQAADKFTEAMAAYNNAVTAHNAQIEVANTYLKALDQYAADMNVYTKCERQALAAKLNAKS